MQVGSLVIQFLWHYSSGLKTNHTIKAQQKLAGRGERGNRVVPLLIGCGTLLLPNFDWELEFILLPTYPCNLLKSKSEVLQTPSAVKSKPRSGGREVKVFESLKKI